MLSRRTLVCPPRRTLVRTLARSLGIGVVATVALAACGSAADDAEGGVTASTPDDVPTVLATTTVWADVTRNVGCNNLVAVDTLMPAGTDPHGFEPSLRDRERMGDADVIVANGLGLEEALADPIAAVESDGVTVVRVGDHVDVLDVTADDHDTDDSHDEDSHDEDGHGGDSHDEDSHDGADPHVWFDPLRVAGALPAIGDALVEAGADREAVDACIAAYTDELTALDAELAAVVAELADDRRLLVTNHHSLGYFADRYGFEVIGTVIPSATSLASTNPADLERLAAQITAAGVPAIFAETQHSSEDTEALADRLDGVEVVTLQTDTLGKPGSDTATYVGWLRATTQQIIDALS